MHESFFVHDRKVVRRRRAVLGLLVGCALILLTAYFGEGAGGGLHAIQRGALAVFSPIESVAADAVKPFRDLFGWFGDTFDAKGENKKLKKENGTLRVQVAQAEEKLQLSTQLQKIEELEGTRGLDQLGPVNAQVVLASPVIWYSTVNINRGSGDGVHVNDPVINGDGLVGRVIKTVSRRRRRCCCSPTPSSGASAKRRARARRCRGSSRPGRRATPTTCCSRGSRAAASRRRSATWS